MLPDALSQLMDMLLRLPHLEAAQVRELIQQLPDPHASAEEMVRRGWITQHQFSSLFPDPRQRPAPRDTMLLGCGDDESPPDADGEDWSLPLSDEEDPADVPPEVKWAQPDRTDEERLPEPQTVEAVPVLSGAASTPQVERDKLAPSVPCGTEARRRESDTDKLSRRLLSWASRGMLLGTFILGSFFTGLQFFGSISTVSPVAGQESTQTNAGNPAKVVNQPPPLVPITNANQPDNLPNNTGHYGQPPTPVAVPKPKSTASLYARVRQVVRENKTEETARLGIGDTAYNNVPNDGSIMVGMEVTYTPFINHQMIKSVQPIYQNPDGSRYSGPICGNPTQVRDRVEAKEGYAIGGEAIKSSIGIDGMQLTFMAIGADGLNPNKTYLSKWLGVNGGSDTKMYVNDGRPIVGIAGMRSKDTNSPCFCLCLVTTKAGAIANADGQEMMQTQPQIMQPQQQQNLSGQQ